MIVDLNTVPDIARPFGFFNILSVAKYQKNEAGPFKNIENISKIVSQCQKNEKEPFVIFEHPNVGNLTNKL